MNGAETLQRKILLKGQAVQLIRDELADLRLQKYLLGYRDKLAGRIGKTFNPGLSARMDQIQILLDSFGGPPSSLSEGVYSLAGGNDGHE